MTGPPRAVAEVRRAVRRCLADLPEGATVLVAVSGGADSMALAAAVFFESRQLLVRPVAVVVDHRLQPQSADVARATAERLRALGYERVEVRAVEVGTSGGPEAAAREARYRAITACAEELGAKVVLLGHTRDDQAESMLLGLARGSGAGSIKGMAPVSGPYRRPLLDVSRATTVRACQDEGLPVWEDPHNDDPRFARVRVRHQVMPVLEAELGPGVADALARTARLLQADDEALRVWADEVRTKAQAGEPPAHILDVEVLRHAPAAVRLRVIRAVLLEAGVPGGDLRSSHLADVDALVVDWHGQGEVHLPGRIGASRSCGRLLIAPADRPAPHR